MARVIQHGWILHNCIGDIGYELLKYISEAKYNLYVHTLTIYDAMDMFVLF